jgi:HAE1 family hydrophobic/amphiphilic exporter-1
MKLVEVSTRRRVTIGMCTIAILMFGIVSLGRLKINLLPDLSYPTLTVRTEFAGAAPAEIENLISKPIEESVGVVKNVLTVSSISRTGQSDVVLEFAWGTDMDLASVEVREKLDVLQLPLESERPVILRFDPSLDPIMRLALVVRDEQAEEDEESGIQRVSLLNETEDLAFDEDRLKMLRRYAEEQLKKELESAIGVAAVKVSGGLEDEIQVYVDQNRLAQLNLPIEQVASILRAENVNLSGGRLEEGTQHFLVRTINQFKTVDQIRDVVVATPDGAPVYLRDIATVRQGYKERDAITRLNGEEAVELAVYKEGDANTVAVARAVEFRLNSIEELIPEEMEVVTVYDQSHFIESAVNGVVRAGFIGGLLAMLILYLFLRNFWTTVIISVSIPVSVIATFNMMYGADLTLNIMSLGGLALGIGLLVDNSIVVLENMARHRDMGKSALDAAREGASEVGRAVTASTITTVAVFFPLVFVSGIAGQLFRDQALTVTFSLLASLLVALTLIPMLASTRGRSDDADLADPEPATPSKWRVVRWMRAGLRFVFSTVPAFVARWMYRGAKGIGFLMQKLLSPAVGLFQSGFSAIERIYPGLVRSALNARGITIVAAFSLFVVSILLIPRLGVELIPQLSQGEFLVEFRMPPGTPLDRTDAVITRAQASAGRLDNVRASFAVAGSGNRLDANPEQGGENWGELSVTMDRGATRDDEEAAMRSLRGALERSPGLQYKFDRPTLFTFKTPIEVEVAGYDLDRLKQVSDEIARDMTASSRFADVKSTMEEGHPEIRIVFDRERAAALGLPVYTLADRIVDKIRGEVATQYSWRDRKIDVLVRAREEDRTSIDRIRKLIVNPQSDRPIPLEAVADVVVDTGPGEIRRVGQERVALVRANLREGDLGTAVEEIRQNVAEMRLPTGISVRIAGQNKEMSDSFRSLLLALGLAVFLVYLVMASQFESLLHPFVILLTIPLALVGAILSLWVTGNTISVVVFIGMILLAGIVVNNAIVLVDLINQLRAKGMEKLEAIVEGGRLRLRPILMTTLTTALGLLPLALGFGEGAEVRAPMAITVIGGLLVATALTLVVIPVMYAVFDRRP